MRKKKGQSILEYVIVLTAIVAAIAYAATQFIKPGVQNVLERTQQTMEGATDKLPYTSTDVPDETTN